MGKDQSGVSSYENWIKEKVEGFDYLILIFIVTLNIILFYNLLKTISGFVAALAVTLIAILFFRIVVEREMKILKEGKDILSYSLPYLVAYFCISLLIFTVLNLSLLLAIFTPIVITISLISLRKFYELRLEKKRAYWLEKINFDRVFKKEKVEKEMDLNLTFVQGVEIGKNDRGANIVFVLGDSLEELDNGIEKLFIGKRKRVSLRAAALLKKAEREIDFRIFYDFPEFKTHLNDIQKDTLVFCEGLSKEDLETIKANL